MNREEPMLDLAGGDVGMSRHLAKALNIIVGSPGLAPDLKAQMQEILQGKGTIRDLVHSESFARLGDAVIPKALEDFAATSPEEIQRKAELGNAVLESYRNQDPETSPPQSHPRVRRPSNRRPALPSEHHRRRPPRSEVAVTALRAM